MSSTAAPAFIHQDHDRDREADGLGPARGLRNALLASGCFFAFCFEAYSAYQGSPVAQGVMATAAAAAVGTVAWVLKDRVKDAFLRLADRAAGRDRRLSFEGLPVDGLANVARMRVEDGMYLVRRQGARSFEAMDADRFADFRQEIAARGAVLTLVVPSASGEVVVVRHRGGVPDGDTVQAPALAIVGRDGKVSMRFARDGVVSIPDEADPSLPEAASTPRM